MTEELGFLFSKLPQYLGGHILLSMAALGIGLLVSIPTGIAASRFPRLSEYLLGAAGILQTVPTLALLALMVPLLGGMIGFVPAFLALTLYSILPILANTITGIRGVDPTLTEAARGLGMNEIQLLTRVQLPLAAPVIISGIRTATVLVVGTATLALPVGGLSLGNYIFSGLSMNNIPAVLFGCLFTALLAILMDQLVHVLELAAQRRSKPLACWGVVGFVIVLAVGCFGPVKNAISPPSQIVASAAWTEQGILSETMKALLERAGLRVDQREGMGETIQFHALKRNQIDCCVNYTGNIWVTLMGRQEWPKNKQEEEVAFAEIKVWLRERYRIECLGKLGFQNNYVLAMDRDHARELGIQDISDLQKHPGKFKIAGDEQFFLRPESRWLARAYRLQFRELLQMDPGLIYDALRDRQVQVICAYSSDGRIKKRDLLVLNDDANVLPKYDAILLLSPRASNNPALIAALTPMVGQISQTTMEEANYAVDRDDDRQSPRKAAEFVLANLGR